LILTEQKYRATVKRLMSAVTYKSDIGQLGEIGAIRLKIWGYTRENSGLSL